MVFKYQDTSRSSIALNSTPPFKTILNRFERSPSLSWICSMLGEITNTAPRIKRHRLRLQRKSYNFR